VVPAELVVPVAPAGLALVQLEGEPELVPVAAELELVLAAVALRTKSVIALHLRGLLPLLVAEEDLAAVVVETMHEPAAAEVATAWAAAE
jgi:hypothetical protein